jgi:hypothetical protein
VLAEPPEAERDGHPAQQPDAEREEHVPVEQIIQIVAL